ncbi:MurR/RpiR family transcriptional regulator [Virgibacillus siamensis]|uniref:MurR/RpiR family transcriptional regulator n=1 Tax=Virgibacillus siamensis TaxID=480071 RepID=UPI00098430D4|nr:MurR/RpiR family transcriptional regulator [Virgibacillus siamensis]
MTTFQEKIDKNYATLTSGLKKVASYLLEEPMAFAANPAKKVGESIGVSETMVVRLCIALGYRGYSELQQEVREHVFEQKRIFNTYKIDEQQVGEPMYQQIMRHDQINIQKTSSSLNEHEFNETIRALAYSERILVSGLRYTFSMAHWLTYALLSIGLNAHLFRPDLDIHMEEGSKAKVLVVFSFHAYSVETLLLAEEAKKRGWLIIGFTDSRIAPISEYADILYTVHFPERMNSETAPVVFSLLNAIVSGISQLEPERTMKAKQKVEENRIKGNFKL